MIFFFWFLVIALAIWHLGTLGLVYHVFAFRYPRDITIVMLLIFVVLVTPISLITIGYLADFYGKVF